MNMIETKTPIGLLVVDETTAKVVHVVHNGELMANCIVYSATIKDYKGERGNWRHGLSFSTSVNEAIMSGIIDEFSLLIDRKKFSVYPVEGGYEV